MWTAIYIDDAGDPSSHVRHYGIEVALLSGTFADAPFSDIAFVCENDLYAIIYGCMYSFAR